MGVHPWHDFRKTNFEAALKVNLEILA